MHPIFSRLERLAVYLAAWMLSGVLLSAVFTRLGFTWTASLALLLPLSLVYAFVCLSAWYVCRATPLRTSGMARVVASSALATTVAAAVWLALARVWMAALGGMSGIAADSIHFTGQLPLLFTIGALLFLAALAAHYALVAAEAAREADRHSLEL